jgi:hypothetical protein
LERRMESEFFITVYAAITDGAISRKFFLKFSTNTVGTPNIYVFFYISLFMLITRIKFGAASCYSSGSAKMMQLFPAPGRQHFVFTLIGLNLLLHRAESEISWQNIHKISYFLRHDIFREKKNFAKFHRPS